jgi:hypothetical protein
MYLKYISLSILLATAIKIDSSQRIFNELAILEEPNGPGRMLPTAQEVIEFKKNFNTKRSTEEQLHNLFIRYVQAHRSCVNQNKLYCVCTAILGSSSAAIVYLGWEYDKQLPAILTATALVKGSLAMQTAAQDYAHDQECLIHRCTDAFDISDLETLKKHYEQKSDQNSKQFLQKIIQRKEWVINSQKN